MDLFPGIQSIDGYLHAVAVRFENNSQQFANVLIVVHDQDQFVVLPHEVLSACNSTVNVEPAFGLLSTRSVPPRPATRVRKINRPGPSAPDFRTGTAGSK